MGSDKPFYSEQAVDLRAAQGFLHKIIEYLIRIADADDPRVIGVEFRDPGTNIAAGIIKKPVFPASIDL